MVLLIESIELTGSIRNSNKEAFSTQNEEFRKKVDNIFKKYMYTLLGASCGPLFP